MRKREKKKEEKKRRRTSGQADKRARFLFKIQANIYENEFEIFFAPLEIFFLYFFFRFFLESVSQKSKT